MDHPVNTCRIDDSQMLGRHAVIKRFGSRGYSENPADGSTAYAGERRRIMPFDDTFMVIREFKPELWRHAENLVE